MKRVAFMVFFSLLGLSSLTAQERKIEFEEYDLPNGLHVILHEDHSTPIVAVAVMYHVGSKNEDPERTGFAHFFEHLMFEGSENIGRGDYMKIVQNAGGQLNANTTQDRTYYYEILPSNQLELALWLESERMLHAKVDTTGVETQREVVKEERRQRIDNRPYGSFTQEAFKRAFSVHPYHWSVIGSMDHLNAAQIDEFIDFYKTFYVPNNATLIVAGDIDPDAAKKMINDYFAGIPKSGKAIPRPEVKPVALNGPVIDTVYDNIQLPALFDSYRIPGRNTDDYYAMSMLTQLLSGGESARLNKVLVDQKQMALAIGAFPYALEDAGLFIIFGIPNAGIPIDSLQMAVDAEIERVKNEAIPDKEFQKLRNQIKAEFVTNNSTMAGIASSLATYNVLLGNTELINTEVERYMQVTPEDIQRVAREYLSPANLVRLYYLPKQSQ